MGHSQGQGDSYDKHWTKVHQLEKDDLTKSALKEVKTISEKAKREKNSAQIVKSLLYTSKYALILEEDAQLKIIDDFRKDIESAKFPTKNVLESYLANLYWQYFQQNRYQFYNRTKTERKVDSTDFRTWDLTTLFHEIGSHFEASLKNKEGLQKTKLDEFGEILVDQSGSENYRPTLFDLLAHTALDFYKTDENNITRPADKFEIDDPEILCEAYAYTQREIDTQDKTSLQSKALEVYQELLKFHFSDPKPDALTQVDIERLKFIHQNAIFQNKDSIYLEVLQNSASNLEKHPVAGLYTYEIAQLYRQQGNTYDPKTKEEHRWKQKEALDLCESVISKFPDSRGAEKCRTLKSEILATDLQLTAERHIPINKDARILVDYKNLDGLRLKALRISQGELKQLNKLYQRDKQLAFLKKLTPAKTWEANLKNERDYQSHGMEVLLPALENGQYVILATPLETDTENSGSETFAFSPLQVTDMALITTRTPEKHLFQVIDRRDGHPVSNAPLKLTNRKYNNGLYRNKSFKTDKLGTVDIPLSEENWRDVSVTIDYDGDKAHFGPYYVNRSYPDDAPVRDDACFLFTDRSIYRPGQPLYFKGIAIKRTKDQSEVMENTVFKIELKNVNGETVGSQELKTNAFGSFSGEFILPDNGLTGSFSLQARTEGLEFTGYTDFSVEEYKRPKFETSFKPITETFRVNDSITVKGVAKAYAGSNLTDAKVSYRVKRVVRLPRWYYWSHPYFNAEPQEIARGQTVTDASGNYEIEFKALPDNSLSQEEQPIFRYEVTADVTDINGETHSATTAVSVGYHAMTATIGIPDRLDKSTKADTLQITTNNLNGQPVSASGTLKMYKLEAPDRVLRPRSWETPDYKNWDRETFKKMFPHTAFADENDPTTWEKGKLVWETDFDTGKSTKIPLEISKKWISGKYVIELETTDKFGQEVTDMAQTTVYDGTAIEPIDQELFRIGMDKDTYAVGEEVEVTLISAAKNLAVTVFIEKNRKIVDTHIIRLSDNSKSLTVPITADDIGGFAINYSYSAFNTFHSGKLAIAVPRQNTDLDIETLSFRNKIAPGTDETWSFKITGANGDKVSAELLAGMYDASLDSFRDHSWNFSPLVRPAYASNVYTNARESFGTAFFKSNVANDTYSFTKLFYDSFKWFGLNFATLDEVVTFGYGKRKRMAAPSAMSAMESGADMEDSLANRSLQDKVAGLEIVESKEEQKQETSFDEVQIRKNLQETAFFFPQLQTDEQGNVSFTFTTPEALTKWKLQLLAHTKTLQSTVSTMETVTQKELMVLPNVPRFLREGDEISISTKITNLTDKALAGQAKIVLTDAVTTEDISKKLLLSSPSGGGAAGGGGQAEPKKNFKVDSMGNTQVAWRLKIPDKIQAVQYKIIAKAGNFSDGEQNLLPVLTNRKLVTETLPMWVRSNQTKTFTLDKLKNSEVAKSQKQKSTTLRHHKLTLEITSNPAWYAVQALPYLMEYPYECNEQTFARYYANSLASHIANSNPRIQEVFKQWANSDALLSNLEKNEELKSLLIQETPWLRDAQSETEQKKRIALLYNMDKMKNEQSASLSKLKNNQRSSGAWPWFNGGPDNRFITQHIIAGMGHLKKLNVTLSAVEGQTDTNNQTIKNALAYLDSEFIAEYDRMKNRISNINDDHLSQIQIHYLYMRSFFPDIKTSKKVDEITAYYKGQAKKYWTKKRLYQKGMLALALYRMEDVITPQKILRALKENSITSEELGMYWKENTNSWQWYQAPIETQALMIEAFGEIHIDGDEDGESRNQNAKIIDNLKIWLLKQKQTNQWSTTKSTTEAVYALLLQGSDWLSVTDAVDVQVGGKKIEHETLDDVSVEAGTGYYKTSWDGSEIHPKMAEVQLTKKGDGIAWGALYWQYFENLDKITSAETPLQLKKNLFLKKNTNTGEEISEITQKTDLKVGDLVRVRIELRADRDMEFLHMKDMRAAGFEPINVLSRYKWQDGLGYYESTKDASTDFFFDNLPKGIYVFEYDLRVNNAGEFSNGITTIQSMYAPEFSSHSEGIRVEIGS